MSAMARHFKRIVGKSSEFKAVFASDVGQRVLGRILGECGVAKLSYIQGSPDRTNFNEGLRSAGLYIMDMVDMDLEKAKQVAEVAAAADHKATLESFQEE